MPAPQAQTLIGVTATPNPPAPAPISGGFVGLAILVGTVVGLVTFLNHQGEETPKNQSALTPEPRQKITLPQEHGSAIAPTAGYYVEWAEDSPHPTVTPFTAEIETDDLPNSLAAVYDAGMVTLTGSKGSGKTTAAAAIARERIKRGHTLIVFNHHYHYGAYKPLKVWGIGSSLEQQFEHIAEGLKEVMVECDRRYAIRQSKPESEWEFMKHPITVVVEELGQYDGNINKTQFLAFLKTIVIAFRKANMYFVGVSQDDTMVMFGGAKGLAKSLKNDVVNLELLAQPSREAIGGLMPKGTGWLSVNGGEKQLVSTSEFKRGLPPGQDDLDFSDLFADEPDMPSRLVFPELELEPEIGVEEDLFDACCSEVLKFASQSFVQTKNPVSASEIFLANLPSLVRAEYQEQAIILLLERLVKEGLGRLDSSGANTVYYPTIRVVDLSGRLRLIAYFAEGREWVSANDVKKNIRQFKDTNTPPETIRQHFLELADLGVGEVRGEGENLRFRAGDKRQETP